jgi:hypothetical protein
MTLNKTLAIACAFGVLAVAVPSLSGADGASDGSSASAVSPNLNSGAAHNSQMGQAPGQAGGAAATQPNPNAAAPDPHHDPYNTGVPAPTDAGVAATSSGSGSSTTTTTSSVETKWKDSKTCTDSDGVTYYRGKKGYDHCVTSAAARKGAKKDQMGGTVGSEPADSGAQSSDPSLFDGRSSETGPMSGAGTDPNAGAASGDLARPGESSR